MKQLSAVCLSGFVVLVACTGDDAPVESVDAGSIGIGTSTDGTTTDGTSSEDESTDGEDTDTGECGDGVVDPSEQCDDGNDDDTDGCTSSCELTSCGNGQIDPGESCDEGPANADDGACTSACQQASCGDGLVWAGMEECDNGPNNGPVGACLEDCVLNVCGDGHESAWEGCDDGNLVPGDGCSPMCTLESCGNGIVDADEDCDDGNDLNSDDCTNLCQLPVCGDGLLSANEACDLGPANANDGACTLACADAVCGDGLIHDGVEGCDDGNANADDASCKSDCTPNVCGDGFAGPGEGCDDGNGVDDDACTNGCVPAACGDGIVQQGEDCDDGNMLDNDGCTNACSLPACGDGILQPGEQCDDGNNNGANASCTPVCTNASCGDGYVWAMGGEACDDGNDIDTDACTSACGLPVCGDTVVQLGEDCDDGNMLDNDGCSDTCTSQQIVAIDASSSHTCALMPQNTVRCWGYNSSGQLGRGNTNTIGQSNHPYQVGNVLIGPQQNIAASVEVGTERTCIIVQDGGVRCFGRGLFGQLGYASTADIGDGPNDVLLSTPVMLGDTAVQLAAGRWHTCALLQSGAVMCWGNASSGELGYGNTNRIGDDEHPIAAGPVSVGGNSPVVQVVAGMGYTCTRHLDGSVRCWGSGFHGTLGSGSTANIGDDELPSSIPAVSVGGFVSQLSAGQSHVCALMQNGTIRCWGQNGSGQLGYGIAATIGDDEVPSVYGAVTLGGTAVQVSCGTEHTCALLDTGAVRCWGEGTEGRLGYGNTNNVGDNETPASVGDVNVGGPVIQVAAGGQHTCALLAMGSVRCWGQDDAAPLIGVPANHEDIGDDEAPATVAFVQIY